MQNYEIGLSFAGRYRSYVRSVAEHLQAREISVFFDEFEEYNLWGRDLDKAFFCIFAEQTTHVVLFTSKEYLRSHWTNTERRGALARKQQKHEDYILQVRFDSTIIPGLNPRVRYEEASRFEPAELAATIAKRFGIKAKHGKASDVPPPRSAGPFGEVTFDYTNHDGRYVLGSGPTSFETKWSSGNSTRIKIYNDPQGIHGVALARQELAIPDIRNACDLNFTSRVRSVSVGGVVILHNSDDFYAALQVLNVKHGAYDGKYELDLRYFIQRKGQCDFSDFSLF